MKKEYRGQRSPEAFEKFIKDHMTSPVQKRETFEQMDSISVRPTYLACYVHSASIFKIVFILFNNHIFAKKVNGVIHSICFLLGYISVKRIKMVLCLLITCIS